MIKIKIDGIDKLNKKLKKLQTNIEELDGKKITVRNREELDEKIAKELFKGV